MDDAINRHVNLHIMRPEMSGFRRDIQDPFEDGVHPLATVVAAAADVVAKADSR